MSTSRAGADGRAGRPGRPPRRHRPAKSAPITVDPARKAAYDLLRDVDEREAYANLAMPAILREAGLAGRDAAFAVELGYGTLRRRGTWDAVLAACVDRPLSEVDPGLLDLLRLGTHQLLGTRVPPHAAVSATVDLARIAAGAGPSRYVNAVLRRVAERDPDGWLATVAPPRDSDLVGHLAVRHSHPRWVVTAFADGLGGDLAEAEQLLVADNTAPKVSLVARPGLATVAELQELGAEPGRWSPYAATLEHGDPTALEPVRAGRAGVQDEGSQLVTLALAAASVDGRDNHWLDLCAGPGGKAALLAALAAPQGARLLAVERAPHRAKLVSAALRGSAALPGGEVTALTVVADGTVPAWPAGSFDRVLVDVPCTGLGALRRRPEARWRRQPADIGALRPVQTGLLTAAVDAVRPGGLVGYVTCSPHLGETRVVVSDVMRGRTDLELVDARPYFPGVPDLGDGPTVQLWPHRHGTDAMYLALLRRT
ncbi:MAG: rRNA cytosine-C5-methyltransferase [Sporichthyaceae bacterium]|nr:rRNA cytosine-C5-methyltransferase [Sporichthyaceae bacterium]